MDQDEITDEMFTGVDFSAQAPTAKTYENCTFNHCLFSNVDLSGWKFSECVFENCDLSMATLENTALQEVEFKSCKLMGLRLDECHQFRLSFRFEDCLLDFTSFYQLKLKNTTFLGCSMVEVEFIGTDLTGAHFDNCDLRGAVFENTLLEAADLRTATNYQIDPELNRIRRAKFSLLGLPGLLGKYDIIVE